ncbi:MAG: AAA family ATPase, partial [Ignavibacteria bacterium]
MFSLIWGEREKKLWISFLLLFITYSACYAALDYSMNFAFLLLGYFSVELVSKSLEYFSSRRSLESIVKESEILKSQLKLKEDKLKSLQAQMENSEKENEAELKTEIEKLKSEIEELKSRESAEEPVIIPDGEIKNFEGIIYSGPAMEKVVNLIKKVADTETTVLIMGESGAGKELVARALHNLSRRKGKNFLAVNCAALTESLLESELFGHVKGAFTNAIEDKAGLFEAAKDGTIFLDEIGEISPSFQSKLLRVLQNGEYHRVGSSEVSFTNARIIAATNKNLEEAVKSGEFREDLFYRLNVINIQLPPLRERKEDIIPLAKHFLKSHSPKL